jgi:hypothetical protein
MTHTRAKLIKILTFIQNRFPNQDILTFSGFMDDRELSVHIISYAKQLCEADKIFLVSVMRDMRTQSEQAA